MSDRRDRPARALTLLALAAAAACHPLNQAVPPPSGDGGTPCTASTAVRGDVVAVTHGICNPWCIAVPAGTAVTFLNQDPILYQLVSAGAPGFEVVLAPLGAAETPPLTAGVVVVTAVENAAATVTILVE